MIFELRTYHVTPGKMVALHDRFVQHTLAAWTKHGITQVGFWTTLVGPDNNTLTYLLAWESMAERERRFSAFQADPEWIAARAATEVNGILVQRIENVFLAPTAYSKLV